MPWGIKALFIIYDSNLYLVYGYESSSTAKMEFKWQTPRMCGGEGGGGGDAAGVNVIEGGE